MTPEATYNIDYNKVATWLLPRFIRKPKMVAFMVALLHPVVVLYFEFKNFRKAKQYQLSITPQVCFLEKILNDRYDFTARRIYIADGADKPPFYLYKRVELKPKYFFRRSENKPQTLYTRGENAEYANDFIIYVPAVLALDFINVAALVRSANNLPGTKFKIQNF
jgi:hypothetical protein